MQQGLPVKLGLWAERVLLVPRDQWVPQGLRVLRVTQVIQETQGRRGIPDLLDTRVQPDSWAERAAQVPQVRQVQLDMLAQLVLQVTRGVKDPRDPRDHKVIQDRQGRLAKPERQGLLARRDQRARRDPRGH